MNLACEDTCHSRQGAWIGTLTACAGALDEVKARIVAPTVRKLIKKANDFIDEEVQRNAGKFAIILSPRDNRLRRLVGPSRALGGLKSSQETLGSPCVVVGGRGRL